MNGAHFACDEHWVGAVDVLTSWGEKVSQPQSNSCCACGKPATRFVRTERQDDPLAKCPAADIAGNRPYMERLAHERER